MAATKRKAAGVSRLTAERHVRELLQERAALMRCVERAAAELERLEANGADEAIAEDGRSTIAWANIRDKHRRAEITK